MADREFPEEVTVARPEALGGMLCFADPSHATAPTRTYVREDVAERREADLIRALAAVIKTHPQRDQMIEALSVGIDRSGGA